MVRGLLWLVAGVLFAYVVFELVRGYRLRSRRSRVDDAPPSHVPVVSELFEASGDDPARREMVRQIYEAGGSTEGDGELQEDAGDAPSISGPGGMTQQQAFAGGSELSFQSELETRQLRHELARLEALVASQREELAALGEELRLAKSRLESSAPPQAMSPEYSEALVFARRGLDAEAIAERCGISQAEAELVHALSRKGQDEPEGEA